MHGTVLSTVLHTKIQIPAWLNQGHPTVYNVGFFSVIMRFMSGVLLSERVLFNQTNVQSLIFLPSFHKINNTIERKTNVVWISFFTRGAICWLLGSFWDYQHSPWARTCKRLRSLGIDSEESIPPGWKSIHGLSKRFKYVSGGPVRQSTVFLIGS